LDVAPNPPATPAIAAFYPLSAERFKGRILRTGSLNAAGQWGSSLPVREVLQQHFGIMGLVQEVFSIMTQFWPLATFITSFQPRQDQAATAVTQSIALVLTPMCVTPQTSVFITVIPHSDRIMPWNV